MKFQPLSRSRASAHIPVLHDRLLTPPQGCQTDTKEQQLRPGRNPFDQGPGGVLKISLIDQRDAHMQ